MRRSLEILAKRRIPTEHPFPARRVPDAGFNPNPKGAKAPERKPEMAYKKPQIVAKSASKQNFVGPCPVNKYYPSKCDSANAKCHNGDLR